MLSKIIERDKYSFVALVITSWHLDNLIAYLHTNKYSNGLLIVAPQLIIKKKPIYRLEHDNWKQYVDNYFSEVTILDNPIISFNKKDVIGAFFKKKPGQIEVFSPGNINIRVICNVIPHYSQIKCTIIDEGIGAFLSAFDFEKIKTKSDTENSKESLFGLLLKRIVRSLLISEIKDAKMLRWENGKLAPNKMVCSNIRKLYETQISSHTPKDKNVLLFKDFGIIPFLFSVDIYKVLLNILQQKGYSVYIKMHPNDVDDDFNSFALSYSNVNLIQDKESGERLVVKYSPRYVLGGFSTVIFSTSAIFNTTTISFMNLYQQFSDFDKEKLEIINWFYSKLKDSLPNMKFVASTNDFDKVIK